jgi:hypothetical protein
MLFVSGAPLELHDGDDPAAIEEHYHFHMTNRGMIGSQRELETWLVKTLDTLRRTKRLPAATAGG